MVAPVNNTGGLNSLLRALQTPAANQAFNRQVAQAVLNRSPSASTSSKAPIELASAKSPPPSNLPRGSIVDRLV